ncbi:fumarylacetoacetate hydrolase family protein [Rossellomorea aquimaris]|uniref:Fumarylacetoacetate hydrolase n=1 Tax=Rossellomorea aquimaris TaxID=189382 RepID=A0A366EUF3_9BACI|nr:fumarylacetoacetate hydrolase family protein [Rossellomorea aquimaris]RBP06008.1 fumarylacetoacetate hydrolase [Rossellomorea aquimaris]
MKLVSFLKEGEVRAGFVQDDLVVDIHAVSNGSLPKDMLSVIDLGEEGMKRMKGLGTLSEKDMGVHSLREVTLKSPIPRPVSIRDFYAFEEHVKTARKRRGLDVVPEWYDIPVFYFTNHLAVKGPLDHIEKPADCEWLDYELEIACVIGKEGKNITKENAEDYIYGYFIMNDWSARDIQKHEMKVGLGPAKGKDFATSFGPYLVTKDELDTYRKGDRFDLPMTGKVNGKLLSKGNYQDIHYTFADMIERASKDVTLYPGEVIGSGTVGTGCILELGTETHPWLKPGDVVELEITGLGVLRNTIVSRREEENHVLSSTGENTSQTSHHV